LDESLRRRVAVTRHQQNCLLPGGDIEYGLVEASQCWVPRDPRRLFPLVNQKKNGSTNTRVRGQGGSGGGVTFHV